MADDKRRPLLVAFVCNWCTYAGADLAGTSRMQYPADVRVIKLPCSGRIDPLFILKAFERGADGVLISGCHPGDCHYISGNLQARRRFAVLHDFLDFCGISQRRLFFSWVSASEGRKWADLIEEISGILLEEGPLHAFETPSEELPVGDAKGGGADD